MNLDELIRQADPSLGVEVPAGTSPSARWAYPRPAARRAAAKRHRSRIVGTGALALVAATALVIGLVPLPWNSGPPSPASAFLNSTAELVSDQPPLVPPLGQYLYVVQKSQYRVSVYQPGIDPLSLSLSASAQYGEDERTWVDAMGNSTEQVNRTALSWPSAVEEQAWEINPGAQAFSNNFRQNLTEPTVLGRIPDVAQLPTEPAALAAALSAGGPTVNPNQIPDGANAVFERAARLAVGPDSGLTPALSAALYRVMAAQPGVQLLGQTIDHQGRTGTAVGISTSSGLSEVVVDPHSGAALEAVYAPPALTVPAAAPNQPCSSTACSLAAPGHSRIVYAPLWTDNISAAIVSSSGSNQAAAGS